MNSSFFTCRPRLLTAALTCLFAVTSYAANFTVSNTADSGAGSLRLAITDALAGGAGPHDIQAGGVTGTISLQTALPVITNTNIRIHGPTSGTLTVTRGVATAFRIFTVNNTGGAASLTVNRMSITNGDGGTTGGNIYVVSSALTLNFCTVSGGICTGAGGGIAIEGTSNCTVNIHASTISGNISGNAQGGGLYCNDGTSAATHTLNITNSTFSGNRCTDASAGGLFVNRTLATLRNCTISGNRAGFNSGGVSIGSSAGTLDLINCTVANNTADDGNGGGMRATGTGGSVANLINTIFVGNVVTTGSSAGANDVSLGSGTRTAKNSVVGVLATGSSAFSPVTNSQIGTSGAPKEVNLGPLANNGGPTQTHALLASSPELAINLGSNSDVTALPSDQRGIGYDRVMGGTVDIGAFETGTAAPTLTGVTPLGAPAFSHAAGDLTLENFTVPPGTDRLLLVVASDTQSTDVTSVSFGGTAMTQSVERNDSFAVDSIWVLPLGTATTATTGNITITRVAPGDRTLIAAQVFQNVHQTNPVSATDSFEPASNATSVSRTIASATGDLVFDVLDAYRTSSLPTLAPTASNGQAVVHSAGSAIGVGFDSYKTSLKPGAASVNMNWTTSSEDTLYLAVNLKQAAVALSNNADLSGLSTTASGMTPAFGAGTTAYTATVPNGTTTTTVTATRAEANATLEVRVNGGSYTALTSGVASSALPLNVGANPIDVRVTAQDGTTIKTYTITVTRAAIPPNLTINDVTANEGNSGTTNFTFTVSLSAPAGPGGVTFDIATANGSATTANSDYAANSLTGQTIPTGSSTYTFTVQVTGDTANEPSETFFANVTNVVNAVVVDGQGVGTIVNDDPLPSLSVNDVSVAEGNAGTATLTFTVTLSAASGQTVTVNYATADGTATTAGSDYTATSGTLTFTPGQTTRTINVSVNGDTSVEANETFFVNLSGATNATISDNQGLGTINNDDVAADIPMTLTGGNLTINAGSAPGGAQLVLRFVAPNLLEIFDSTRTLEAPAGGTQVNANTVRILIASLTGGITLTGSIQADVFTLDFSAGDICPPGGIAVNGGAPTSSPGDLLVIDGDFSSGGAYGTGAPGAGTLTLDTGNTVSFTGLEPVDMSAASFTDFTVTVDPGNLLSGNVITTVAAVDAGVNTNISFGASGLESAKLGTVTGTLTINGDNVEHDYFVLQGLGTTMTGHFVVDALGGDSDVIEVNNTTFTVAGLNKNLSLKADFIGLGRVNAVSPADNPGVIVCSGNITLDSDGDSAVATPLWGASGIWGPSVPTYFNALQAPYTSRGSIQILGDIKKTAGADAALLVKGKHSVLVLNTTAATGTSPAGSIVSTSNKLNTTLHADSDASGAGNVMLMHRSVVTTNGGTLTIGGGLNPAANPAQGIAGATTTSPGVSLVSTTITTAGGALSIRGQGAASSGGIGVLQNVSAGSVSCLLSTGVGGVTIVGTGGNNATNTHGYFLLGNVTAPALSSSIITTTGFITINGAAGVVTNDYVRISSLGSITSGSGNINFTASLAGHTFMMNPANAQTASVSSTSGNITIRTDKMNLNGGAGTESISTGTSNEVNLRVATGGVSVDLGSAVDTTASMLELGTAELNNITAGTLRITSANLINVTAVIAPANFTTLSFDPVVGTSFTATGGFTSDVTSGSVFERMIAGGTVNITAGAALTMNSAGGYVWNGTDTFTLLTNDSTDAITGTFTGPTLTNFLGSSLTAQQSYTGGTGNDLVFSAPPSANADLSGLVVTTATISPVFDAGTTSYTSTVPNGTSSVTVTATRAQANATLEARVNGGAFTGITSGTPSGALALNVGSNTIDVKVTAQDTTTTKTYTITITRSAPPTAPTITSVAPARAPLAGGTTVIITGTDFTGATGVTIGGTAATGVVVDSPTQITATVPLGTSGISDITVTTGLGTGTGSGLFYYYAASGGPVAMAASKVDIFTPNGAGKVLPGAPIQYRTLIANTGGTDATEVNFADAIPANTEIVPGSVNVSPLAVDDSYATIVNTQLAAGGATPLSGPVVTALAKATANDREFLTDTFTVSASDTTSAAGGSVVMASDGSFTYVPPVDFTGVDSFTYTIRDDGTDSTAGNADDLTGTGIVTITVNDANTGLAGTQKVWYIDNSYAGANGASNGTSARPFTALSAVSGDTGPDLAGDTIFVAFNTDYAGGITLLADQTLWGEGTALVLNGITLAVVNDNPVITNSGGAGITLATNNTITGMAVANTSTFDIDGGAVGNLTIANTICNGTGGIINISTSGALNVAIAEASTTSAATGISLTGCSGTFTAGTVGSITGVTGTEINLSGGTMNFTYSGGITSASNSSIVIVSRNGGSATFAGLVNITGGTGVTLAANAASINSFTGGLTVSTGASPAFAATGGGTVNVTGTGNTLTTTTGTALNVTNTVIGSSGLTFQSITAGTGAGSAGVGISLDNTGASGGLTVTGTGTPGSGGTIQHKTGANLNRSNGIGIYLNNTARVSLSWMQLNDFDNFAIRGFGVSVFTLANCVINGVNGNSTANLGGTDELGEGSVYFGNAGVTNSDGLNGTVSITNSTIQGGSARNLSIADTASTSVMHATIAGCTFGLTQNLLGGNQSLAVEARNAGTTSHVSVTNSTFTGSMSDAMNFTGQTGTIMHVTVGGAGVGNTITNSHPGNNIGSGSMVFASQGIMFFDARNNTMSGANGSAVTIFKANAGTQMEGTFDSNVIGTNGVANSGSATGNGIFLSASGAGAIKLAITNNIIQRYSGNAGIYADNTDGSYTVDMTVTGNTLRQPGAGVFAGLAVTNGSPSSADTTNVFLRALNNNFADGDPNNVNDVIIGASGSAAGTHTFTLSGATAGDVASEAAIEAFIKANNNLSGAAAATFVDAYVDAPVTFSAFKASASLPAAPTIPSPLLFAETEPGTPDLTPASKTASEAKTAVLTSKTAAKPVLAEKALTNENLQKLVLEAKARWIASGLTSEQKAALEALRIEISDLNELHLGQAAGDLIQISRTAAGNAWFIDQTPSDDAEFDSGLRNQDSGIQGVDLLTTLMHEMGHRLGLPDTYALRDRSSIMYGYLTRGERRLPAPNQARGAALSSDDTQRFLDTPIDIGILPAGKSVTIVGTVLVKDPANTQLISSQGTVSGTNFTSILTDDPAFVGAANPTTTPVERPDATVVSLVRTDSNPNNTSEVGWQVVFSAPVSGLNVSHFALVNAGLTAPSITSLGTAIQASEPDTTWNITVSTGSGSGTLGLNMTNDTGALSHDITNLPSTGQVYTIDKTAPVFTLMARQSPSVQNTNADTLTFQAAFSETVTGVNDADFTVSGTTATISSVTGTGPYEITLSGGDLANLNGTVSLALAAGQNIADTAGNPLPATAPITNQTYIVDNAAPTVALSSTTLDPAPNAVIPVTVQFSETVTGFDLTDITVIGGAKGNFVAVDGDTYTFDLTPSGPGVTVTADVAGSAAQDAAGNNNTAATQFTRTIVDAVSIAATTATAVEGGTTGLYTFTRGASTGDLTVSFQLAASSTATAGTDFTLTSGGTLVFDTGTGAGTIVIPNGQLSATVTLTALTETPNPAEAAETARLNVVAASGYVAGSPANATVTISANSFLVTTTANSGEGSLRQAVFNANNIAGADTITFSDGTGGSVNFTDASADTITLSGGQISLDTDITIVGTGADRLIVQNTAAASATSRVFVVSTGPIKTVRISGLTITGGNPTSAGGGLLIDGSSNATVSVIGCAITGNSTTIFGGGIAQVSNTLSVVNSTISGNTSAGAGGGGGIDSSGTSLTMVNSTLSGNSINGSSSFNGGALRANAATTAIRNCTFTNNTSVGGNSGLIRENGTVTVSNSIIAGNVNNTILPDVGGTFTSGGGNLIGNSGTATGFTNGVNNDQVGNGASPINPQLAALANNGGRTQTHALLASSPALNAGLIAQIPADTFDLDGDTNVAEPIPFDQRGTGFTRAIGTVDIGAFELQKSVSIGNLAAISEGNSGTTNFVFTITRTGDTTGDVNMTYTVSGAAVNAADFGGTLPTGTATITTGNAATTVTIPVSGDTAAELNEAFTVTLSAPDNGYVVAGAPATSTINNDDTLTVTINQASGQADPANTSPINFTAVFSEPVTGFATGDVTLGGAATPTTGTVTEIAPNNGTTFNVAVSGMTAQGAVTASIGINVALSAGGAGNAASTSTDASVIRDSVAPTLNTIGQSDGNLRIGDTNIFTFTFSEAVTGFTNADLTIPNGSLSTVSSSDGGITWSATFTPTSNVEDSSNIITVAMTGLSDLAGNAGVGTRDSGNFLIDTRRPTALIVVTDTALRIGETSLVTITFSEAVTGFTNADLIIANGTLSSVSSGDGGITWTATLTPSGSTTDATNLITLDNTGVSDAFGNAGSGTTDSNNYAIDTVRPTAGIVVADNALRVGETSLVTFTFSEAVSGFTNADLSIANGTLSSVSSSDGGITWTATLTPNSSTTDATNVVTLDNTGYTDVAGNTGTGTTNSNNYAIDTVRPTVGIVVADNALRAGETSAVIFTFSEAVTGFTNADLTIANGTLSSVGSSDGGITWIATFTPNTNVEDSTNLITLDNTGVQDLAGNAGTGTTDSNNYAIDTRRPTATLVVTDTTLTFGETSLVTITFNEAVTGFTNADLSIANGTLTSVSSGDGGITWTATFTPNQVVDATNVITLDNTGVADAAGNAGTGSTDSNNYAINILVVSITAPDADADENTAGTGTFRVTRNTSVGALTVQLAIDASSSAVAADWTQSGATLASRAPGSTGTITIPDGSTSADITLTPSADLHAEAAETVRLNVTADAAYTAIAPTNAIVTIGQNDFLVINTNDAGEGSLRQAVLNSNVIPGDDTITFDATVFATPQTITLITGQLSFTQNAVVQGTGAQMLTINGNASSRIFNISAGSIVLLSDLTATNGFHATSWGGAINVVSGATVTVLRCVVSNSTSQLQGGGIYVSSATLNVVSSTISGNTATTVGGGAISTGSVINETVRIINSTISGNTGPSGGALHFGTTPTVSILNSTLTNNTTTTSGGSVAVLGGTITVSNSLIAANVSNTTVPDVSGAFTSSGGNVIGNAGTATGFTHGVNGDQVGSGAAVIDPLLAALADNGGPTLTHMLLNGSPAINNGLAANLPADTLDLDGDLNVAEALPVDQRGGVNIRTRGPAPDAGAVEAFAFEPTITASPATNEDTQTTSGLVITANTADGGLTTHYQITGITAGTLFKNDGTTVIAENDFITKAEGAAGLKFTPSLNLNNTTTALFGFTVQAAIGSSTPDLRGATVSTTISVNPVNDAPTVVAPGIPDQTVTVGTPVVVPLGTHFADVDLDTLTFSVTGNTDAAKATATLTGGTNVTLTALAFGETDVTITADDSAGGTVTDTFRVFARTIEPTALTFPLISVHRRPGFPAFPYWPNPQTAAFDFDVQIRNTTAASINGLTLSVNISAYTVSHPDLRLVSYTRLLPNPNPNIRIYEIDYNHPVAAGDTLTMRLSFFIPTRQLPADFAPVLDAQKKLVSDVPGPMPNVPFVDATIQSNAAGQILLTWPSTPGQWYRLYYNDGPDPMDPLATFNNSWLEGAAPLRADANQTQWIDTGAPFTRRPPAGMRFYRVSPISPP